MAIYKRGRVYWYHFVFNNQRVQCSTKQGNPRVARQIEAAHKTRLAKGEVGIAEPKRVPTLLEFGPRFKAEIKVHCAGKPRTIAFWDQKLTRLLETGLRLGEALALKWMTLSLTQPMERSSVISSFVKVNRRTRADM